ncbi:MAG: hypothetical protein SFX19_02150 [Alphaproteobacteria bacterium]|nr:hypothetical protein [Alphaproteobacteria bacterium]
MTEFVTITEENKEEHRALLEQYRGLLLSHNNRNEASKLDLTLKNGEVIFLSLDASGQLLAGVLFNKNLSFKLKNNNHLPRNLKGNVGYAHALVASDSQTGGIMPGLTLQQRIISDFRDGVGEFSDIDVLTADVVGRNMLLAHEASKEVGLKVVARKSLQTGHDASNQAHFVAIARDPDLNLIPVRREGDVVSDDEMAELAHQELVKFKEADPRYNKEARAARRAALKQGKEGEPPAR